MEDLQPLHSVSFERRPGHRPQTYELRVLVDGVDLGELIRPIELPFASAEGNPELAGRYAGLHWPRSEDPLLLLQHYLGEPDPALSYYGGRTQVLGCDCGEPGCWPLACRIIASTTSVHWSDFQQAHRRGQPLPRRLQALLRKTDRSALRPSVRGELALREAYSRLWTYDSFGPFVFHRPQFEEALLSAVRG